MIGYNIYHIIYDSTSVESFQDMFVRRVPISGTYKGETIVDVSWDSPRTSYIVTTEKKDKEEEVNDYYSVNGDVVEATSTGDVFLYLGGMFYNLSSGASKMRGRKSIRRQDGPLKKLSNIANSGALFKEAVKETYATKVREDTYDRPPF